MHRHALSGRKKYFLTSVGVVAYSGRAGEGRGCAVSFVAVRLLVGVRGVRVGAIRDEQ